MPFYFRTPIAFVNPIILAAAVLPALALLLFIYRKDKLEKESPALLVKLLVFGALAAGIAMLAERAGMALLGLAVRENTVLYQVLEYFVVVACAEEGAKYLLLKRCTWKSPDFNCKFDGVVYAVFVSLGFALLENSLYVFNYGLSTALLRAVTAVPGHACFGVFMGTWYGLARMYHGRGQVRRRTLCNVLAVVLPVAAHGCYDFIATMETAYSLIFVGFILALFAAAFLMVQRVSKSDSFLNNKYNRQP